MSRVRVGAARWWGARVGWSWSLLAICLAVASAVIVFTLPSLGSPGRPQLFARFSIAAGICAVGSSLMYAIYLLGGGVLAIAVGDTFMVLAPGGMLMALGVLSGRMRSAIVAASCAVVAVAVTSAFVGIPISLLIKVIALTMLCALTAREALRQPLAGTAGAVTLVVVNIAYAVFSVGRIVVALTLGVDSLLYELAFATYPTTVVGAVAVAATGVAVIRIAKARGLGRGSAAPKASGGHRVGEWWVALPEPADLRAAFGGAVASRFAQDLSAACEVLRGRLAPGDAGTRPPESTQHFPRMLRAELEQRGWSESEIAVVTIVDERHCDPHASRTPEAEPLGG